MAGIEKQIGLRQWLILGLVLSLLGCQGQPLPADKKDYIGTWYGDGMKLLITADGGMAYERKKDNTTTTLDAPIQEFGNDHITAGFWIFSMEFKINRAPYKDGDAWRMIIDGVTLTKQPQVGSPVPKPASGVPA